MPLGIERVAYYIPELRLDLEEAGKRWEVTVEFLREKTGFTRVARAPVGESALDLAMRAWEKVSAGLRREARDIELLVFVTQTPGRAIPQLSAQMHARLQAAPGCLTLDLALGCSGYVYGLSVALAVMKEHGLRRGLLVTADPYSRIIDPSDKDTVLLFGDAATATLLGDDPQWECGKFHFHTDGSRAESLALQGGHLRMHGAQVFQYAATRVPIEIAETLRLNELRAEDVDAFLIHSGSRYIVETIARRCGLPLEKVPFPAEDIGNTVSSSLPLLLEAQKPGTNLLLAGFGVGLSCATTVLRCPT